MASKKKFLVDIYIPYVKSVIVEAKNEDEAESIVRAGLERRDFDPRDFKPTEDSEEISVYGEAEYCFVDLYPLYTPKKKNKNTPLTQCRSM